MNGNYLLDTNIIIALFDKDSNVIRAIETANEIYITSFAIGELYYGAYNSGKQNENILKIDEFKKDAKVLDCDGETSKLYGRIKKELKDKGNPIPENDIWIAAQAIQYNLELVSRDKHFEKIEELKITKW